MTDLLQIPLYHITHIDNLPGILAANGLWCDCEKLKREVNSINIAHSELKERRMGTSVPLYPHKKLGEFVPFYFTNRSPMLYAIHTGFVKGYKGGQESIVYLVSSIGEIMACRRNWCFTDGHAVEAISDFYNDLSDLEKLDWNVIDDWSWKNSADDNDRKRRKQAEFLVEAFVPLEVFLGIGVKSPAMQERVHKLLFGKNNPMAVSIEPDWYYN